uniref:Uncharacterized protein n=1 Tax=viral metagenome TaxID=1070528 RepID=A0A2V0R8W2_9ZZZZ
MSYTSKTKEYAIEVAQTALSSFERQARGTLEAPNGDENVRLYTAKGGSAITMSSTVTSATIVYDPEATVRNGQLNVVAYGRNSSGQVVQVSSVNLGRPTDEFLSVGVLSSGLKVLNSSGVDVIGGTQSAGILTSVPRDISTLDSTSLANACSNHERDLASGVISRDESTVTVCMTEHFGKKMALCRSNTLGNIVQRTWDDGIGNRKRTIGQSLGPTENKTLSTTNVNASDADVIATDSLRIMDTNLLDAANNPLTLATYSASFTAYLQMGDPDITSISHPSVYVMLALDAANNVIGRSEIRDIVSVTDNQNYSVRLTGSVSSSTVPIHRVVVGATYSEGVAVEIVVASASTFSLTAFEETADIAARPIHVCVLEGLNASATLNLTSTAVLCGVPDSTNVFIGATGSTVPEVYDTNAVEMFLKSIARTLPRAFTISGHGAVTRSLTAMYGDESVDLAFKAMSFSDVSKKAADLVRQATKLRHELAPYVETVGAAASMLPGTAGAVGRGAIMASRLMDM